MINGLRRRRIALFVKGGICDSLLGGILLPSVLSFFDTACVHGIWAICQQVWMDVCTDQRTATTTTPFHVYCWRGKCNFGFLCLVTP